MKWHIATFLIGMIFGVTLKQKIINFTKKYCKCINNKTTQNFFQIITGIVAAVALLYSISTYNRSVIFGNRPIPKIVLEQDQQSEFLKFSISNRGKNPLTGIKIVYKFIPVQGDSPIEDKAKHSKVCLNLIEQGDDPVSFSTRYKISDLSPEVGHIFFFIGMQSESLYGEKYYFEDWYYLDSDKKYYSLKGNYCALGEGHRKLVKSQEGQLKKKLKEPLNKFCEN